MVLNHVMSKDLAARYREDVRAPLKDRRLRLLGSKEPILRRTLEKSLKKFLTQFLVKGPGAWEDASCLDALVDTPCIPNHPALERYLVREDDALQRRELVGQLGVKATMPIEAFEVLGFYGGYYCTSSTHDDLADNPPKAWVEDRGKEGQAEETSAAVWEKLQEQCAVELEAEYSNRRSSGQEAGRGLVVNAFRYGNILSLVNDPGQTEPVHVEGDANVEIHTALINNFKFAIMATSKRIEAGEDLRYDNGVEYWKLMRKCDKRIARGRQRDIEERELVEENQRLKRAMERQAALNTSMVQDEAPDFQPTAASTPLPSHEEQPSTSSKPGVWHEEEGTQVAGRAGVAVNKPRSFLSELPLVEEGEDGEGKHGVAPGVAACITRDPDVSLDFAKRQKLSQTSGGAPIKTTFDEAREAPPRFTSTTPPMVPGRWSPAPVTDEDHWRDEELYQILSEGPGSSPVHPLPIDLTVKKKKKDKEKKKKEKEKDEKKKKKKKKKKEKESEKEKESVPAISGFLPELFRGGYPGMQGQRVLFPADPRLAPSGGPVWTTPQNFASQFAASQLTGPGSWGAHVSSGAHVPTGPILCNVQHGLNCAQQASQLESSSQPSPLLHADYSRRASSWGPALARARDEHSGTFRVHRSRSRSPLGKGLGHALPPMGRNPSSASVQSLCQAAVNKWRSQRLCEDPSFSQLQQQARGSSPLRSSRTAQQDQALTHETADALQATSASQIPRVAQPGLHQECSDPHVMGKPADCKSSHKQPPSPSPTRVRSRGRTRSPTRVRSRGRTRSPVRHRMPSRTPPPTPSRVRGASTRRASRYSGALPPSRSTLLSVSPARDRWASSVERGRSPPKRNWEGYAGGRRYAGGRGSPRYSPFPGAPHEMSPAQSPVPTYEAQRGVPVGRGHEGVRLAERTRLSLSVPPRKRGPDNEASRGKKGVTPPSPEVCTRREDLERDGPRVRRSSEKSSATRESPGSGAATPGPSQGPFKHESPGSGAVTPVTPLPRTFAVPQDPADPVVAQHPPSSTSFADAQPTASATRSGGEVRQAPAKEDSPLPLANSGKIGGPDDAAAGTTAGPPIQVAESAATGDHPAPNSTGGAAAAAPESRTAGAGAQAASGQQTCAPRSATDFRVTTGQGYKYPSGDRAWDSYCYEYYNLYKVFPPVAHATAGYHESRLQRVPTGPAHVAGEPVAGAMWASNVNKPRLSPPPRKPPRGTLARRPR